MTSTTSVSTSSKRKRQRLMRSHRTRDHGHGTRRKQDSRQRTDTRPEPTRSAPQGTGTQRHSHTATLTHGSTHGQTRQRGLSTRQQRTARQTPRTPSEAQDSDAQHDTHNRQQTTKTADTDTSLYWDAQTQDLTKTPHQRTRPNGLSEQRHHHPRISRRINTRNSLRTHCHHTVCTVCTVTHTVHSSTHEPCHWHPYRAWTHGKNDTNFDLPQRHMGTTTIHP